MTKLWCIALALGGPEDGMVVVSIQMAGVQEMATAQAVSAVYRQTGSKLPLMGVNTQELSREYLAEALRLMDEEEQRPPGVVQLVPYPRDGDNPHSTACAICGEHHAQTIPCQTMQDEPA